MALATLSVDLVAKIANFEKDLGKAARAAESNAAKMNAAFGGIKAGLAGLAASVTVGGLVSLAKSTIDSIDALNDLKDATGASIENISALEDVAARTGTSMDTVAGSLIKFNKVLSDAKPGSDAARALDAIGLSAEDLKKIDPAEALRQTAVALAKFADDGDKARLVQDLFGKSAKEAAPFLKDLAEQTALIPKVTKQAAEEAEKFNKQMFALQKTTQDLARYFASDLVIGINAAIKAYKDFGALPALSTFALGDQKYREDKKIVQQTEELLSLEKEINQLKSSGIALDQALATKKQTRLNALKDEIKITQNNRKNLTALESSPDEAKPSVGSIPDKPTKTKTGGAAKDPYAETKRYIESLQQQIEKTQELTTVQQLGFDINAGRLGKMTATQQQQLIDLAQKLDATKLQTEAEKDLTKALADRITAEQASLAQLDNEYAALIERLTANTPTMQFKAQQQDLAALQEAFSQGAITEQLYAEAVADRFDLNNEKLKETKTLADDLGLTFASAFEDALVSGGDLSDVLKGLEQDIIRITARKLITEPLGNAVSGAIGGLFAGLSFDGGGYTGNSARVGGLDGKGGFMAMLHPQETITDHTKGQTAGGSTVVNHYNFTVGDVASVSMVKQAIATSQRQVASVYQRNAVYGS